jgi:integrase
MDSECRLFEYADHWLVRRRDTPFLYIYWCEPGTRRVRRRSTHTSDLADAKQKLIAFATKYPPSSSPATSTSTRPEADPADPALPTSAHVAPRALDTPVLDLLAAYVERFGSDRPSFSTLRAALRIWMRYCQRHDIVYVSELNHDAQERFVSWRRRELIQSGKAGSNGTINRDFYLLKGALRLAWRRGQLSHVPYVLSLPAPPPRDQFLTAEEAQRLLAACDEVYVRRFVLLALHTLQRPKAIFDLRVEQVDLAQLRINFLPTGKLQTNKRRPMVPITPTLRDELALAVSESRSGYIVEKNGLPLQSMRKAFARAAKRAGLPGITPYVLRHTGATLLAASGVPMHQIASMLGHTTQRMTEVYAKRRPEFLKEAVSTLDGLFGAAPSPCTPPPSRKDAA